jgi:hypothetical protein
MGKDPYMADMADIRKIIETEFCCDPVVYDFPLPLKKAWAHIILKERRGEPLTMEDELVVERCKELEQEGYEQLTLETERRLLMPEELRKQMDEHDLYLVDNCEDYDPTMH